MAASDTRASQEVGAAMPQAPPRENLYRINPDINVNRAAGNGMPTMTGHFAVWDQWTEIRSAYEGNFMERFWPGAMTKTLSENTPKVLFQHGKDPQIGDKVLGPIQRVEPDTTGAFYEVQLLDTSYNRDLLPGLEAGLYGASFRFSVLQEEVVARPKRSDFNPRGIPERTVTEAKVMEFGPVTFPAYAGATAGVRSITDEFLAAQLLEDEDKLAEFMRALRKPKRHVKAAPVSARITVNGVQLTENRADMDAIDLLVQMHDLGEQFIALESDEPEGADPDVAEMNTILASLEALVEAEAAEPEDGGRSLDDDRAEPDPSGDTTHVEPEPSAATTRSNTDLFWFVTDPSSKGAKSK